MKISDLLPFLYKSDPPIWFYEFYPCIIHHYDQAHGTDYYERTIFSKEPVLPGAAYRRTGDYVQGTHDRDTVCDLRERIQTIPCPWRSSCRLVQCCPIEIYRQYLEKFGGDEFRPVK